MVPSLIAPDWPAPENVKAFSTLRTNGYSKAPFDRFNLGDHVGDLSEAVQLNRQSLQHVLGDQLRFHWLTQVHGTEVVVLDEQADLPPADAVTTESVNQVCLVMTADCLPVIFSNTSGSKVAAAHAGWRGLCDGVLEATVRTLNCPAKELMAWMGPAIGPAAFQVGAEVVEAFSAHDEKAENCFIADPQHADKWLGDLYQLARQRLSSLGIEAVYGGGECTFSNPDRFFSYRRDGQTGRMATGIWIASQTSAF